MDRIKHKLHKEDSANAVNVDTNLNINVVQNNKLLPYDDITKVLNVGEQFQKERMNSSNYRFIFTITSLFSNVLTNVGTTTADTKTLLYFGNKYFTEDKGVFLYEDFSTDIDVINASIKDNLIENNGWLGYYVPAWDETSNKKCQFVDLKPERAEFDLTPTGNTKNWDFFLTYPHRKDDKNYLIDGGILIINISTSVVNNQSLKLLTTPIKHGLQRNDIIRISGVDYTVVKLGLDDNSSQEYNFVINLSDTSSDVTISDRFKRVENGMVSQYYARIFKVISDINDYEIFPIAFSKNIFSDKVNQIIFNTDLDVSQYKDNLGRPLSEIYLTMIKTNESDSLFDTISSGVDIPFFDIVLDKHIGDIRRIHNVSTWLPETHTPIENDLSVNNTEFYGDIVEYNPYLVKEVILCEINHRFSTKDRNTNKRPEGYFYKPHHLVKIREWSSFVEQGDSSVFNVPSYAEDLGDGRLLWRDLLDIGFTDGQEEVIDYPFLNGSHYIHTNVVVGTKRQDPFNLYGLYYSIAPRDWFGKRHNTTNHLTKNINTNGC